MSWELAHLYRFICIKCNIEMVGFFGCLECKYQVRMEHRRKYSSESDRRSLNYEYRFTCVECDVEMIFSKARCQYPDKEVFNCPKCNHQVKVKYNEERVIY